MRYFEPCLCGDPECPACGPWYAERLADDEAAALAYQRMCDDATHYAEQAAADAEAEAAYARDDDAEDTDIF